MEDTAIPAAVKESAPAARAARPEAPAGSKWCSGAATADPPRPKHIGKLEEFTTTSKSKDGRVSQCRACFAAYRKASIARANAAADALGLSKPARAPKAEKPSVKPARAPRGKKAAAEAPAPKQTADEKAADKAAHDALLAQARNNGGSIPAEGDAPDNVRPLRRRTAKAPVEA